ncbi:MAG: hypothetical protein PF443_01910, partial [Allgaiera sp.]|nr:hypothetical protein [Allgaiera sp.]
MVYQNGENSPISYRITVNGIPSRAFFEVQEDTGTLAKTRAATSSSRDKERRWFTSYRLREVAAALALGRKNLCLTRACGQVFGGL